MKFACAPCRRKGYKGTKKRNMCIEGIKIRFFFCYNVFENTYIRFRTLCHERFSKPFKWDRFISCTIFIRGKSPKRMPFIFGKKKKVTMVFNWIPASNWRKSKRWPDFCFYFRSPRMRNFVFQNYLVQNIQKCVAK